ncbi:MAG: serine protein kinase RIO, partial [Propionibacteriaceae bacterium]
PTPPPAWVVTDDAAIDTELGILKSGKEADVFLLERATAERSSVLAAKRYRSHTDRMFHRDATYTEGRIQRRTRDRRAVAKSSRYGRRVESASWAAAEFAHLSTFWSAGLPVPYPVQLNDAELLMEFVTLEGPGTDGTGAPRLAQCRPGPDLVAHYFAQLRSAMIAMAGCGLAHGDLSPYNVLATGERIVIIDLPQAVDVAANPSGMEFLARDCRNVCRWFVARGLEVDADALLAELVAAVY